MPACIKCQSQFEITPEDRRLYDKLTLAFQSAQAMEQSRAAQKSTFPIQETSLCQHCQQQLRMAFRNEWKFYRRKCDLCAKTVVSIYNEKARMPIYCATCWWGDKWDGCDFGQPFDFDRTFTEQFLQLQNHTPRLAMFCIDVQENSDYTNYAKGNKNCYLLSSAVQNEDCAYGYCIDNSRNCLDCDHSANCELCYNSIDIDRCYHCFYAQNCSECHNVYFSKNLIGCNDCFGCKNLRYKSHHWFNERLSKEEFKSRLADFQQHGLSGITDAIIRSHQFFLHFPEQAVIQINCENCTGDHLRNCKNCRECFDCYNLEDCARAYRAINVRDCFDIYGGWHGELQMHETAFGNDMAFVCDHGSWNTNIYYCQHLFNNDFLFGCIGLRHKQYCILNKQYSKEEYYQLVPKIIEHMQKSTPLSPPYSRGEASEASRGVEWPASRSFSEGWGGFFHPSLSPFGYNETIAQEYFPLTKEQALEQGFNWSDYEAPRPQAIKTVPASKLPEIITEAPDEILNWAIECQETRRPFLITKQELRFYRDQNLPLPHYHPDQRRLHRLALRNPRKLWNRTCNKCNIPIQTSYSPDRPETVYCEKCYLEAVY
ncbi:MAG: hypothetical protein NTZ80_01070 [Patescibacteria group bacterium]|nr:hypothetical protein [Patescibacteria group bacterium]